MGIMGATLPTGFRLEFLPIKKDSWVTVRLCKIPSGNCRILLLRIRTLRISRGIIPNSRQGQQMRNSHKVRMGNELNIS